MFLRTYPLFSTQSSFLIGGRLLAVATPSMYLRRKEALVLIACLPAASTAILAILRCAATMRASLLDNSFWLFGVAPRSACNIAAVTSMLSPSCLHSSLNLLQ